MAYLACAQKAGWDTCWKSVWSLYRELTASGAGSYPPSGTDLVAQWQGGVVYFDPRQKRCQDLYAFLNNPAFLVFSATSQAGRKVATHDHLAQLQSADFDRLGSIVEKAYEAILEQNTAELGSLLTQYAEVLHEQGLEIPAAYEDRIALQKIPGVLGVKGTGALLADGMIILVKDTETAKAAIEAAQARGLTLVSEGLQCEMGVGVCP